MTELTWPDAITEVLEKSGEPMHYADITQRIIDEHLRDRVGATPAATVAATLSMSLKNLGELSPFYRVGRGMYRLRSAEPAAGDAPSEVAAPNDAEADAEQMGLINAFGVFWSRNKVRWTNKPTLLGKQQDGSEIVDFAEQQGVYLLYDVNRVIYVGRVEKLRLGMRLSEHTRDRHSARWDRFSWFGVRKVQEDGQLAPAPANFTLDNLIPTMEALLIEGLEPPQNRRQGDGFNALEFLQHPDPTQATRQAITQLLENLR